MRRFVVRSIVSSLAKSLRINVLQTVSRSGMFFAFPQVIANGLNFMNTLFHSKPSSVEGRNLSFERSAETGEGRSIALLCFTTINGFLSFVAATFTTMLPLSAGWRYFWLFICLATFGLSLIGLVLFCQSYKRKQPGDVY
jgi:hypothetical protein